MQTNAESAAAWRRARIRVHGTVQGVGFRPFVYRLATGLGLSGDVRNAGAAVDIRVQGVAPAVEDFTARLRDCAPAAARIDRLEISALPGGSELTEGFAVAGSIATARATPRIPADLATCATCLTELFDPADRRYRYPFVNCTACGPRATVIDALPYDRQRTTMSGFRMCTACAAEYHDPADRRFHAEPICCPACGPRLAWQHGGGTSGVVGEQALAEAAAVIAAGGIVAVKGIGGYHLVCDAANDETLARLRKFKPRPAKPLAVMAADLAIARTIATVDAAAAELLGSPAAPIVLLPRRADAPLAPGVAPGSAEIGVFLPYSPLHHLLLAQLRRPLIVTSGNRSGSPTLVDDAAARDLAPAIADGILLHDRPIRGRYDDSVVRIVGGRTTVLRRARGYAPGALPLPIAAPAPILAVGAQLKHTCALAAADLAVLGPHTGDLEDAETYGALDHTVRSLSRLTATKPEIVAHDRHPGYLSTQYALLGWAKERRVAVQHHHAHVAATAAEHGITDSFVGVALDGLGLGDDGTLWGGEVLLADLTGYRRVGRFGTAPLPGGSAAVRRPARMALGYLFGAEQFGHPIPAGAARGLLARLDGREVAVIRRMIERDLNCPRASSAGRLFDAMAALLGVCDDNTYEGEAAVRLEAAALGHPGTPPLRWALRHRDGLQVYDPSPTLHHALALAPHLPVGEIAARFHRTVATVVVAMAAHAAANASTGVVCLGGGVFQNARLTAAVLDGMARSGLDCYVGEHVPMNDGGISYGQAAIAAARTGGT
ncbi:hydrogenase maturation protein HypF [Nocardia transvalensis]|uniref:Carbamoyltransferase n=1 Tax=Nocardia transvalensis TaxID=37333 RepID=A0A7W9ULI0_9NOCA|nr:carbamoyltransferase HypF [Nocardia transvalensis]MBB5916725.1 hydrogenase maturation protein HypF [Nocardia transvalensis]